LKVKPGCLLHAILWHCNFSVSFDLNVKLFETDKPFDLKKNWLFFRVDSKGFDFPSFQISKIIKKLAVIDERNE
jgi:hypothetical protein